MMFRSPLPTVTGTAVVARALIVALTLAALATPCRPALAQGEGGAAADVLRNADLEEGFHSVPGGLGSVALGWSPWWVEGDAEQLAQGQYRPPMFEPQARTSTYGVHSQSYAQKLSTLYATHEGGIYQRASVTPGSVVRFSMWVRVWSSSSDDRERSYKAGDYRVSVGLDPYGGTDGDAATVVWSPEVVQYDDWLKLSVSTVAMGSTVTAFARGACSWRVKHNEAVWDNATLHVVPPAAQSAQSALLAAGQRTSLPTQAAASAVDGAPDGAVNVLLNPDFEEAFTERGAGEVSVAAGWHPWWQDGDRSQVAEGYLYRPEYKPERRGEGRGRVHSMNAAQKQFTTYATHSAGIYQRVPVTPGSRVTFSIWAYVWSSAEDDPDVSERPGDYVISVGIDPAGGTDAGDGSVVWSPERQAYDRWVELTVTASAEGSAVTVFTRGEPSWRVKHNDAYWDDATLVVEPGAGASGLSEESAAGQAMVPGKARVLSLNTPTASSAGAPAAIAPSGTGASRPATPLEDQRVGSVPDLARLPRSLGEELSLSYAGAHLSLTWQRSTDGVSVEVHVPEPIEGELALWHQRQALARWAVTVVPGDPLTVHWPGVDLDAGELGVEVRDTDGNVLARCGTVP